MLLAVTALLKLYLCWCAFGSDHVDLGSIVRFAFGSDRDDPRCLYCSAPALQHTAVGSGSSFFLMDCLVLLRRWLLRFLGSSKAPALLVDGSSLILASLRRWLLRFLGSSKAPAFVSFYGHALALFDYPIFISQPQGRLAFTQGSSP